MSKTVLVPIADGCEEIEVVCIIDVLRRAGAEVVVAAVPTVTTPGAGTQITASRGVRLEADEPLNACLERTFDLIALPGGMPGAEHLRDCHELIDMLRVQAAAGRWYAAICAAPAVTLQQHDLLKGKRATCYPAFMEQLDAATRVTERVVVDGNCVTSQGPGTALEFALTLVEVLFGQDKRLETAKPMLMA